MTYVESSVIEQIKVSDLTRPILKLMLPESLLDGFCCVAIEMLDLNYNAGKVVELLWNAGRNGNPYQDLVQARQYIDRCVQQGRITGLGKLAKASQKLDDLIASIETAAQTQKL
jgi:hypothetical protein